MSDSRKTHHWPGMHQSEDDIPTLVPCFACAATGCLECGHTGLVPPEVRKAQREAAGSPVSSEQCDTRRKT